MVLQIYQEQRNMMASDKRVEHTSNECYMKWINHIFLLTPINGISHLSKNLRKTVQIFSVSNKFCE